MRFITSFFVFFVFIFGFSASSYAQEKAFPEPEIRPHVIERWNLKTQSLTPAYFEQIDVIRRATQNFDVEVRELRSYYYQTKQYTTNTQALLDEMTRYAYTVDTADDVKTVNEAVIAYNQMLRAHMANLDVIFLAITMARMDLRLGDPDFLTRVRDALITTISGDGLSAETAYIIVSEGEETFMLSQADVTVQGDEYFHIYNRYYHVYYVTDDAGQSRVMYFDVTTPVFMGHIMDTLREREKGLRVPAQ